MIFKIGVLLWMLVMGGVLSTVPVNILLLLPINDTYKFSQSKVLASLNLAISDLEATEYGTKFSIDIISDTCDCTGIKAPINAMENIFGKRNHSKSFQAVFGPMCDYSLAPVARYAPFWNVAVITVGALAQDFRKNKFTEYRTLTNIGATMYWLDKFVIKVFKHFEWKQVIFLFDKDHQEQITNFNCYLTMASLKAALLNSQITVDYKIREKQDRRPVDTILIDYVANKFSVILLCGSTQFVTDIMLAANRLGFNNGEYVFINFDLYAQMHSEDRLLRPWQLIRNKSLVQDNLTTTQSFESLLTVTLKIDGQFQKFRNRLVNYSHIFTNESQVNYFLASFYDAMHIYIKALYENLKNGKDLNDIPSVLNNMWNKEFEGVTGRVFIDSYGERIGTFALYDMNPNGSEFDLVMWSKIHNYSDIELIYDAKKRPLYWKGYVHGNFPDSPKCGYNQAKCPVKQPLPLWIWLLISMGTLMIIIIIIGIVFYRRAKFEAALKAMNWLIKWEDVSASMLSDEKRKPNNKKKKYLLNYHEQKKDPERASLISMDLSSTNARTVVYKRNWCFIKKINKTKLEITRSLLLDVKRLKDLQNDHITRFIGICLDPNRQYIFTEYCQKGSLQDLLENQQIELEQTFKHHLIHDILKGMLFIHSSEIKCHGNLTSANCVVDSRFTLKITDFGLPLIQWSEISSENEFYKKQLWKAPELQFNYTSSLFQNLGSQKGDVYSFGIIVQEILYRNGVFYLTDEDKDMNFPHFFSEHDTTSQIDSITNYDICQKVKLGLRPSLENGICSKEIIELLKKCWSDNAQDRPDFTIIRDIMRKTIKISGNILDNLLNRMEKYANNLEDLVKERTEDCENERKRAEELLYRLLPNTVASQLMKGNEVKAESFSSVTIYFSDICGFTKISAESTPMQVVQLLNGLYTLFDSIIESFDVYKVETIGDAYMVVSGLPQRHENHAREIARMSLALLENVEYFKIPHLPEKQLELRIGLHTGPCVAGVVGLKMPRYCLFGDTVNTASRMESNGKPLRIHISPQTKQELDKYGTFDIKFRGGVEMKGKGVIETFWLLGENGRLIDKHET